MKKKETGEYRTQVFSDGNSLRGRIPIPVVRRLGASEGDEIVFREEGAGRMTIMLARTGKAAKKAARSDRGGPAGRARK